MSAKLVPSCVQYFSTRGELRKWFEANHTTASEIWIGYFKKGATPAAGQASYDDSVEEALCFGWIDGICKKIDEKRYCNRFTPRRIKTSNWSAPNIERYHQLLAQGLLSPAGITAFESRKVKAADDVDDSGSRRTKKAKTAAK